ncbi:MAG: sulfur carrier protein ThiS [Peptoniphilaceae bacterium]|nr:sulfur carrier protein ThiS [Peptoniphilaceae bacterium]MDY6019691.1 sulfur carrier protein ThiS [Anaerococcus sp.]
MLVLNDKIYDYIEGESLYDFLTRANFDPDFVACEVNQSLVKRDDFKAFILEDKAKVEAFAIVGGG